MKTFEFLITDINGVQTFEEVTALDNKEAWDKIHLLFSDAFLIQLKGSYIYIDAN